MYQAIYRKWRPMKFDDIIGQEPIVTTLKNQISNNKFVHAYIFTGSRGTGKTSCAKILSKAINCNNNIDGNPCGECEICLGIESQNISDIVEMDAASNNRVDDIRLLKEEIIYMPYKTNYRVYIIDEVHMLSTSAFNSLLKVMEEPPKHVVFILATTEVQKVPATILSRCQRYNFNMISSEDMIKRLMYIASFDGIKLELSGASAIAVLADGGMRDALSILDVASSIDEEATIDDLYIKRCCGIPNDNDIFELVDKILDKDINGVLSSLLNLYNTFSQSKVILEKLILVFRNLLICHTIDGYKRIINCFDDQVSIYEHLKLKSDASSIMHLISDFSNCLNKFTNSFNKKIDLEVCLIKACGDYSIPTTPVKKVESTPKTKKENSVISEKSENTFEFTEPKVVAKPLDNGLKELSNWADIIEKMAELNSPIYSMLIGSVAYIKDKFLLIKSDNDILFKLLRDSVETRNNIRKIVFEETDVLYKLGPYNENSSEILKKTDDISENAEKFVNDIKNIGIKYEEM